MKKPYFCAAIVTISFLMSLIFLGCMNSRWQLNFHVSPREHENVSSVGKVPTVRILTGNFEGDDFNHETTGIIEEKTGVHLEVYSAPWGEDFRTKQNVMLASGDIPDIMIIDNNGMEIRYASSGMLLPLNKYFNQYNNIEKSRNSETWNFMKHSDGNVYAIPSQCSYGGTVLQTFRMLLYREDWLKKFNQQVPVTLEEYYKVANTVSNEDPDGDGKKDTYAISGNKDSAIRNTFDHIFGAFGVLPNYWFIKDGRVVNGSILPEAKEALRFINKMYREGMIDPDFITDDQERQKQKFLNGMYSGTVFFSHVLDKNNLENYSSTFKEKNPEGEFVPGKILTVPGYDSIGFRTLSKRGWMRTVVMSQSRVIDEALRVLDFCCSDEGTMLYNFGLKDRDYKVDGAGIITSSLNREGQRKVGVNTFHIPIVRTELWPLTTREYAGLLADWSRNTVNNVGDEILVPETAEYENMLNSYTDEQFTKMIIGVVPIEEGFDRFVQEWNARGGDKVLKALNKAYTNNKK